MSSQFVGYFKWWNNFAYICFSRYPHWLLIYVRNVIFWAFRIFYVLCFICIILVSSFYTCFLKPSCKTLPLKTLPLVVFQFPKVLFQGQASMCGRLCKEVNALFSHISNYLFFSLLHVHKKTYLRISVFLWHTIYFLNSLQVCGEKNRIPRR